MAQIAAALAAVKLADSRARTAERLAASAEQRAGEAAAKAVLVHVKPAANPFAGHAAEMRSAEKAAVSLRAAAVAAAAHFRATQALAAVVTFRAVALVPLEPLPATWECTVCTVLNPTQCSPLQCQCCSTCTVPRASGDGVLRGLKREWDEQTLIWGALLAERDAAAPARWPCGKCTLLNTDACWNCDVCGGKRVQGRVRVRGRKGGGGGGGGGAAAECPPPPKPPPPPPPPPWQQWRSGLHGGGQKRPQKRLQRRLLRALLRQS